MENFSPRQQAILSSLSEAGEQGLSNREMRDRLNSVSRVTVIRDLDRLIDHGLIEQIGRGRNIRYRERLLNPLLRFVDMDAYFAQEPDDRTVAFPTFNFKVFERLSPLFSPDELDRLARLTQDYQERTAALPPSLLQKEFERLTIELSWKSSKIEGNTYSLIDTELLLKEHEEAKGHPREEALMILNHKKALEYAADHRSNFTRLNLSNIESLHRLVVEGLPVETGLRNRPVGIVGTRYQPLDNVHQIREALEKAVEAINTATDPFSKALLAIALVSYIQPFEDGNKRTARLLSNALLLADGACPLSFRSINEADYKKATLLFYEQNNLRFLKALFTEQYRFAVKTYFLGPPLNSN
jgi:Fic family protein